MTVYQYQYYCNYIRTIMRLLAFSLLCNTVNCIPWYQGSALCRYHQWKDLQHLFPNPNALVAISKGMRAVKLCSNIILQFFTWDNGQHRLTCTQCLLQTYFGQISPQKVWGCNFNMFTKSQIPLR